VIAHKISCGNKPRKGERTWQILASLAATCAQRTTIRQVSLPNSPAPSALIAGSHWPKDFDLGEDFTLRYSLGLEAVLVATLHFKHVTESFSLTQTCDIRYGYVDVLMERYKTGSQRDNLEEISYFAAQRGRLKGTFFFLKVFRSPFHVCLQDLYFVAR